MPRRRSPPRLYLDGKRRQWIIRDGARFIRTGCAESERHSAETRLAAYLGQKHTPQRGSDPLITDILVAYATEHLPYTATAKNASYHVEALSRWWGAKTLSAVTAKACRAYAQTKTPAAARRDLETLRAAIAHWHREHGPLSSVPVVILPDAPPPRDRWLTRSEAARLLRAAKRTEHLKRFILLGLHTGSRKGSILSLTWDRIDFAAGVMMRRGYGETESRTKRTPPVRLSRRTLLFLRRWRALDGEHRNYVVHWNGHAVKTVQRAWERAAREAGVRATPHTLRHTRATWLMQAGVDPYEAAGHLGMNLVTLQKYAKHSPDFQKRAAEV
jgi:integrase